MSVAKETWTADDVVRLLRRVSFFEGLPDADLLRVAAIVSGRSLEKGAVLFREGDPGDAFYIVYQGAIEILKRGPQGEGEPLAVRRDGGVFGEMSLLDDAPRSATVRALEDTDLIVVAKDRFTQLLGVDALAVRIMSNMASTLRTLNVKYAAALQPTAVAGAGEPGAYAYGRLIQRGLLPRNAPALDGYDVAATVSHREDGRGTAFWDWFTLADGRPVLAAVSARGNGVPAAHQLVVSRALLRELAHGRRTLEGMLIGVNDALATSALDELEQQVECGLVAVGDGEIEWTGAGLAPAAIIRPDRKVLELPSQGPPLGLLEGFDYPSQRFPLNCGDVLIVVPGVPAGIFQGATDLVASVAEKPAADVIAMVQSALGKVRERLAPGQDTVTLFLRRRT